MRARLGLHVTTRGERRPRKHATENTTMRLTDATYEVNGRSLRMRRGGPRRVTVTLDGGAWVRTFTMSDGPGRPLVEPEDFGLAVEVARKVYGTTRAGRRRYTNFDLNAIYNAMRNIARG
jgi:hypothetical protein